VVQEDVGKRGLHGLMKESCYDAGASYDDFPLTTVGLLVCLLHPGIHVAVVIVSKSPAAGDAALITAIFTIFDAASIAAVAIDAVISTPPAPRLKFCESAEQL
jgi:hypothetical protein